MKKYILSTTLFLTTLLIHAQTQVGNDIGGDLSNDSFGRSVSLSDDGKIVAIGAYGNSNTNSEGYTRVYENLNGIWTQIGNDIDGEVFGDRSGFSISLSGDGSILAVGAPNNDNNGAEAGYVRIFEYNSTSDSWDQIGNNIDGSQSDRSGLSISLSNNGSRLAIGSPNNLTNGANSGQARVFENINGTWTQIGSDLNGVSWQIHFGWSVSISGDGNILAVGAHQGSASAGQVSVYEYDSANDSWGQMGNNINGEAIGDFSGYSISLSDNGLVLAIGATGNDGNGAGAGAGHVRAYEYVNSSWVQIGSDINGDDEYNEFGTSISLSDDGNILAIGAPYNNNVNGISSGHVQVYENVNNVWTQVGNDIIGDAAIDFLGISVYLSGDGSTLTTGASHNDDNGDDAGHVRIYDLGGISLATKSFNQDYFSFNVNQQNESIEIDLKESQDLKQVNIYTINGQYLFSEKALHVSTIGLSKGIYIVEVETSQSKSAKKISLR